MPSNRVIAAWCITLLGLLIPLAPVSAQAASGAGRRLQDEAGIFQPEQRLSLEQRTGALAERTGCEIYIRTRIVPDLARFEAGGEQLFRDIVKNSVHYKIILLVLGYEGSPTGSVGKGKVYTALGAGLVHVLSEDELRSVLLNGGKVTTATLIEGIDQLAVRLETYFEQHGGQPPDELGGIITAEGDPTFWRDLILGLFGIALLFWFLKRLTRCPHCSARLRRQVKLLPSGSEGGSHTLKRTAKCFSCGYVRKGLLY